MIEAMTYPRAKDRVISVTNGLSETTVSVWTCPLTSPVPMPTAASVSRNT
jgi:hypothetical protein